MRHALGLRLCLIGGLALVMAVSCGAQARDFEMGDDNDYPYSIMAPEPDSGSHHRSAPAASTGPRHPSLLGHEKFVAKLHRGPNMFATHGSSGEMR
jgi:hypothetical protein